MAYYLTILLIVIFSIVWVGAMVASLIGNKIGIIGIFFLLCVGVIIAKVAYDKYSNKKDNHYDDNIHL